MFYLLMRRFGAAPVCGFAAALVISVSGAHAASFDCKEAATLVEKLICKSVTLEMLDLQLKGAFEGAQDRSNKPEVVKVAQVAWLKTRDACRDEGCLERTYRKRIDALTAISDKPAECDGATTLAMNECGSIYADRAERELTRYLAVARAGLTDSAKESPEDNGAQEAVKGFEAAQKAWVAYRGAECDAVYDSWSGGTIRTWMNLSCTTDMTKARTLQVWSNWLQFMDNTPPKLPKPRPEKLD
jgi:uncharacterized protein